MAFVVAKSGGGLRIPRRGYLRRGPKLPWDEEPQEEREEQVVVAKSKRQRIKLPEEIKEVLADAIPVATHTVIDAPRIKIPSVGTAVLHTPDDEEEAVLMALLQ